MTIHAIHTHYLKCQSVCIDSRQVQLNSMFFALSGTHTDGHVYVKNALEKGAKYAVIENKNYHIENKTILVDNVLETLQNLAKTHRNYLNIPIIALTGSNGKTTTKELIYAVLSQQFNVTATKGNLNNHIGVPLTLLSMSENTEIGVVEMGANHLNEIAFLCTIAQPNYGYITNFGKAHLEGFGNLEGVIKGKSELYKYLKSKNQHIFINANCTKQNELLSTYTKKSGFSKLDDNNYFNINFLKVNPFVILEIENTKIKSNLIGTYNFNNIAAACLIGRHFKLDIETLKTGIESYIPENNRSQIIQKGKCKIILDAYNANPSSMSVALNNFNTLEASNKIVILGDMFELGNYSNTEHLNIATLAASLNFKQVYLIGNHFSEIQFTAKNTFCFKNFETFKSQYNLKTNNATILIKGSRGMALERVLNVLDN